MFGLDQQRFEHFIILPLLRLLGEVRRVTARQVAANRLGARRVFMQQSIQHITVSHEHSPCL